MAAPSTPDLALPPSITSLKSILGEEVAPRQLVNIIGLAKDFCPPVKTRGTGMSAYPPRQDMLCRCDRVVTVLAAPMVLGQNNF